MSSQPEPARWSIIGNTVAGASHVRRDAPSQDAIDFAPRDGESDVAVAAVADGHGGDKYFRSAIGSRAAVESAMDAVKQVLGCLEGGENFSFINQLAAEQIPKAITKSWRAAVLAHALSNPITQDERARTSKYEKQLARWTSTEATEREAQIMEAYGSTILAVAATPRFMLYVQLGDGDIVSVAGVDDVSRPLGKDERLIANETTSLCQANAASEFRVRVVPLSEETRPAMVLLATDGYSNSFKDDEAFFNMCRYLRDGIRTGGKDSVRERLPGMLREATEKGSGDDIAVGIIKLDEKNDLDSIVCRVSHLEQTLRERGRRIDEHAAAVAAQEEQVKQLSATVGSFHDRQSAMANDQIAAKTQTNGRLADFERRISTVETEARHRRQPDYLADRRTLLAMLTTGVALAAFVLSIMAVIAGSKARRNTPGAPVTWGTLLTGLQSEMKADRESTRFLRKQMEKILATGALTLTPPADREKQTPARPGDKAAAGAPASQRPARPPKTPDDEGQKPTTEPGDRNPATAQTPPSPPSDGSGTGPQSSGTAQGGSSGRKSESIPGAKESTGQRGKNQ